MDKNNWKIKKIDTSENAKMFAEILENNGNKTYFLQGVWGSGKSEYLKEVEKQASGKLKFIYLNLWKPKNNDSLAKKLFSATCPLLSRIINFVTFAYVALTVIASICLSTISIIPNGHLFLGSPYKDVPLYITLIAIILVSLLGFLKDKTINSDKLLMYFSLCSLRGGLKLTKVLVVDDFDRIDSDNQKELYKIFNAIQERNNRKNSWFIRSIRYFIYKIKSITAASEKKVEMKHGKARVIFVGDLNNVVASKDDYLQKIIDQVISLPLKLQPQIFFSGISEIIQNNLNSKTDFSTIKRLFIDEDRTLRDGNQFLDYVKKEFLIQGKAGKVRINQQLDIIYLYLFHKEAYLSLLNNFNLGSHYSMPRIRSFINGDNELIVNDLTDPYNTINTKEAYPNVFLRNPKVYFINELTNINSISDLDNIINNQLKINKMLYIFDEKLDNENLDYKFNNEIYNDSDNGSDNKFIDKRDRIDYQELKQYIKYMPKDEFKHISEKLYNNVIYTFNLDPYHQSNELMSFLFQRKINFFDSNEVLPGKSLKQIFDDNNSINVTKEYIIPDYNFLSSRIYNFFTKYGKNISFGERLFICRTLITAFNREGGPYSANNRYLITRLFSEKKIFLEALNDRMDNSFGHQLYDSEYLLVKLGYFKDNWQYDKFVFSGKRVSVKEIAEDIEKLSDFEYINFWHRYFEIDSDKFVSKELNFNYSKQNLKYFKIVQKRYDDVNQFISNCFSSENDSNLQQFLESSKWSNFVLKIAASIGLYNIRNDESMQLLVDKINQLFKSYQDIKINQSLRVGKNEISEDELLKSLQDLLAKVKTDPYWVKKLN